jgi:hypothetical protein
MPLRRDGIPRMAASFMVFHDRPPLERGRPLVEDSLMDERGKRISPGAFLLILAMEAAVGTGRVQLVLPGEPRGWARRFGRQ